MKAGRELDALIAEKVMGLTRHDESYVAEGVGKVLRFVWRDGCGTCVYSGDMFLPHYSTNIADAWEVVEKLGRWHGFDFMIVMPDPEQTFHLRTYEAGWYEATNDGPERRVVSDADTAPLAICLAALKAKGVTGEQHG